MGWSNCRNVRKHLRPSWNVTTAKWDLGWRRTQDSRMPVGNANDVHTSDTGQSL